MVAEGMYTSQSKVISFSCSNACFISDHSPQPPSVMMIYFVLVSPNVLGRMSSSLLLRGTYRGLEDIRNREVLAKYGHTLEYHHPHRTIDSNYLNYLFDSWLYLQF